MSSLRTLSNQSPLLRLTRYSTPRWPVWIGVQVQLQSIDPRSTSHFSGLKTHARWAYTTGAPKHAHITVYNRSIVPRDIMTVKQPLIHSAFEQRTGTWQYVVADPVTFKAVIIDPVLDFDSTSMQISTESADALLALVREHNYSIDMILETHAHADHITAASYLQRRLSEQQRQPPVIGIGQRIIEVQHFFGARYQIPASDYENVFGRLFRDDEVFELGSISCQVLHLPGHTPDHVGYKIGDNIFAGDSIFNVDVGSARADFPGGSASALFGSRCKILAMPEHTKLWVGHDYPPAGRDSPLPCSTVEQHRKENKHFKDGTTESEFVQMRQDRDRTLSEPKLLHHALQMNIRAGKLPQTSGSGDRLMHLPLRCSEAF